MERLRIGELILAVLHAIRSIRQEFVPEIFPREFAIGMVGGRPPRVQILHDTQIILVGGGGFWSRDWHRDRHTIESTCCRGCRRRVLDRGSVAAT